MSPQCIFIQMSFWDGTGPIFNDSEPPSPRTRGCVLLTVEALCVSSQAAVCKKDSALSPRPRELPCEPAHVSFPISEMGIMTFAATDNFVKKNKDLWF